MGTGDENELLAGKQQGMPSIEFFISRLGLDYFFF